ncbi:MAG: flavin-nucleotide-binding protein [Kordiimonadales bacterium]|nr:MAG: flavin-nucleotide-binding protein [Kordiimonadales bacterium]
MPDTNVPVEQPAVTANSEGKSGGSFAKNSRNTVRRGAKRAAYDKEAVYSILDGHFLCHVGFEIDGQPYVTPTCHWREGNKLYWHGHSKSQMITHLSSGAPACLSVTHLDGLVLARSAFSTSVNYRSAMCFGTPSLIEDDAEFDRQMELFFEQIAPGRWPQLRPMADTERKATGLLVMEIDDASVKMRADPPGDGEEGDFPVWAGVVPLQTERRAPIVAPEGEKAPLNHPVMDRYGWS